jgi:hypothetical protein
LIIINTVVSNLHMLKAEIDITEGLIQLLNEVCQRKMPLWISLSPLASSECF